MNDKSLNIEQGGASPLMTKLQELAQQAELLGVGAGLKERVAVPHSNGGYTMIVRDIEPDV